MRICVHVILALLFVALAASRRFPLKGTRYRKIRRKTPGCVLGGRGYNLEARWSPRLEPRGVMVCVRCECLPIIRKGVLQKRGKIRCKNIKHLCPKVTCSNAILGPGDCCKRCPGSVRFEDTFTFGRQRRKIKTKGLRSDAAKGSSNYFSSLLVGRHTKVRVKTNAVAWARFTVDGKSLKYTVFYRGEGRPTRIIFSDKDGTVLYSSRVTLSPQKSKVICGTWKKVASIYLSYLIRGHVYVTLATKRHKHGEVAGRITTFGADFEEMFVSPLRSDSPIGVGGVALLSYDYGRRDKVRVLFKVDGIVNENDVGPRVTASFLRKKRINRPLVQMSLPVNEENVVEMHDPPLDKQELKWLARGKLVFRLEGQDGNVLRGKIVPGRSCIPYYAILSGSLSPENARTGAAGVALVTLQESGRMLYKIRLVGLSSPLKRLTIEGERSRRNRRHVIKDISHTFSSDLGSYDGWANGTSRKPRPRDIRMLMRGRLFLNVATEMHPRGEIRGRVLQTPYTEHRRYMRGFPAVLRMPSYLQGSYMGASGLAWFGFDRQCILHYELYVQGTMSGHELSAQLSAVPSASVLTTKHSIKSISRFSNNVAYGSIRKMSEDLYIYLDDGRSVLTVSSLATSPGELKANISAPNQCWRMFSDQSFLQLDTQEDGVSAVSRHSCRYDNRVYNDGESWIPKLDPICSTCSCKRGKVRCDKMVCPKLSCSNPVTSNTQCCPFCPHVSQYLALNESCFFNGDKRWHPPGTQWHPYVPPFGYVICALCQCVPGKNKVTCEKIRCPKLSCPDSVTIPVGSSDCCRKCPENYSHNTAIIPKAVRPQGDMSMVGACTYAGSIKRNGDTWKPRLAHSHCVQCSCRNGRVRCARLTCASRCRRLPAHKRKSCCWRCPGTKQARRNKTRRHHSMSKTMTS